MTGADAAPGHPRGPTGRAAVGRDGTRDGSGAGAASGICHGRRTARRPAAIPALRTGLGTGFRMRGAIASPGHLGGQTGRATVGPAGAPGRSAVSVGRRVGHGSPTVRRDETAPGLRTGYPTTVAAAPVVLPVAPRSPGPGRRTAPQGPRSSGATTGTPPFDPRRGFLLSETALAPGSR